MKPEDDIVSKIKKYWISQKWEPLLVRAGLADLKSVASREFDWFEEPNKRRGGRSGVCRIVLNPDSPANDQRAVFLKIQKNYSYRAPNKLFRRQLTFLREFEATRQAADILPYTPEILLFGSWKSGPDAGAVLITKELNTWISFSDLMQGINCLVPPDKSTLLKILEAIAETSRRLNNAGWVHMGFSAKHIFVRPGPESSFEICVVDFEKCRKHFRPGYRTLKDCSHFMRHTPRLSDEHKRHYLKSYFQTRSFSPAQRRLIKKMPGAPAI